MRASNLEILAITVLFVNYVVGDDKNQTNSNTTEISSSESKDASATPSGKAMIPNPDNALPVQNYWMSRAGPVEEDLLNIQAFIVKEEDPNESCGYAEKFSRKSHLLCGGSILSKNYVLTSATCLHEATHVRHNIRGELSVIIAPLKSTRQRIKTSDVYVHPDHNPNPFTWKHLKHNLAIFKLACRINTENFYKVDLPRAPMTQICGSSNCIVTVFKKNGPNQYVILQVVAPDIPYHERRRKETLLRDEVIQFSTNYGKTKMIDGPVRLDRPKRKIAKPPIFMSDYNSGMNFNNITPKLTSGPMTLDTSIQLRSVLPEDKNLSSISETSLYDDLTKILRERDVGNQTIRSLVVRSSKKGRKCSHTGAAVIYKGIQSGVVAIPCDARQPSSKWRYTDLFDNLEWIHQILNEWEPSPVSRPNGTGCSTCVFNFFIEIGCKDKNGCKRNKTDKSPSSLGKPPDEPESAEPEIAEPEMSGTEIPVPEISEQDVPVSEARRKFSDYSRGKSIGMELCLGRNCDKTGRRSMGRPEYRRKMIKSIEKKIGEPRDQKHLASGAAGDVAQPGQPATGGSVKTDLRNYIVDEKRYPSKAHSQLLSQISQSYKAPVAGDSHRERVTNEIGLQNIEGEPSDWLSEVEKGLELSSEFRREIVKSRPSNIK